MSFLGLVDSPCAGEWRENASLHDAIFGMYVDDVQVIAVPEGVVLDRGDPARIS